MNRIEDMVTSVIFTFCVTLTFDLDSPKKCHAGPGRTSFMGKELELIKAKLWPLERVQTNKQETIGHPLAGIQMCKVKVDPEV